MQAPYSMMKRMHQGVSSACACGGAQAGEQLGAAGKHGGSFRGLFQYRTLKSDADVHLLQPSGVAGYSGECLGEGEACLAGAHSAWLGHQAGLIRKASD